jgi:hypothetical protein
VYVRGRWIVVERRTEARRRRWADVVLIVAGLYVFLAAVWAPPAHGPEAAMAEAADHGTWWWVHAIGGFLALFAVPVAMKNVLIARLMAGVAGVVLLAGLLAFDTIGWLAIRSLLIPAVLILMAAPFVGPMPSPEEEGSTRRPLGHS